MAYYHEKIQQHYQEKYEARTIQRYKQYLSDADKSESTVTTTTRTKDIRVGVLPTQSNTSVKQFYTFSEIHNVSW